MAPGIDLHLRNLGGENQGWFILLKLFPIEGHTRNQKVPCSVQLADPTDEGRLP